MKTKYKSLVLELVMKTMAVIGMVYFMNQAYQAYMNSHNPTVLLLLLEELITVFLIVAAKFTDTRNFSPLSMIATTCGTLDLLRKYSSHRINQSCNQIYP